MKESSKEDILELHNAFDRTATGKLFNSNISFIPDSFCALVGAISLGILENNVEFKHEYMVVIDIGGRLTQISLVRCNNHASGDESPLELVTTKAVGSVGTDYIDDLLVQSIAEQFQNTHSIDILTDPMAKQRLYDAVETMRIELCTAYSASISLPFITADATGPKHLEVTYSRQQFDQVISDMMNELKQHVCAFESKPKSVSESESKSRYKMLCVGGGIRIPEVVKVLTSDKILDHLNTNKEHVILPQAPEEIISIGAAAYEKIIQ